MYSGIYLVDDMELMNLHHQVLVRKLGLQYKVKSFANPEEAKTTFVLMCWGRKPY